MNIALLAALVFGIASFALTVFRDIGLSMILNVDAFLIVIGGTTVGLLVGFPVQRLRSAVQDVAGTFKKQREREDVIKEIIEISRMYRKMNVRSLEDRIMLMDNTFLKLGANLLINNHGAREIKGIMEKELMLKKMNCNFSRNVLKTISRLTPSFGLAGTVISLIKMFRNLESVEAVAPLMAVALMSTFYGVIIANLFMLPLCAKLEEHAIVSESLMTMTIEGMLLIKSGEHPLRIEDRLRGIEEERDPLLEGTGIAQIVPRAAEAVYRFQKI
ncbi:MAG: MotA/TolQ/ExbB proton channel family protein [Nitrospiraceae bacterium]|nr:MAG: MotA/TolQ/ExbB proton channel family protein [Nitrospiraceae bacterium]